MTTKPCEVCRQDTGEKLRAAHSRWHPLCTKCGDDLIDNLSETGDVGLSGSGTMYKVSDIDVRGAITDLRYS